MLDFAFTVGLCVLQFCEVWDESVSRPALFVEVGLFRHNDCFLKPKTRFWGSWSWFMTTAAVPIIASIVVMRWDPRIRRSIVRLLVRFATLLLVLEALVC